jgi:hypothetical protein
MGDDAEVAEIRAHKERQYWVDTLKRFHKPQGGLISMDSIFEQLDMVHMAKAGIYLKDVTGMPNMPAAPEEGTIITKSKPFRSRKIFRIEGVTDQSPMPSLLYSSQDVATAVAYTAVANVVVQPFAVPTWTKTVTIKTPLFNAQPIWVTGSNPPTIPLALPPFNGWLMMPGEIQVFPVKDLSNIRFVSVAAGQILNFLYFPDPDVATKP